MGSIRACQAFIHDVESLNHSARGWGDSFHRKKEIFLEGDVYVGDLLLGRPEAIAK